jgi:hypothetical protein
MRVYGGKKKIGRKPDDITSLDLIYISLTLHLSFSLFTAHGPRIRPPASIRIAFYSEPIARIIYQK